MWTAIWAIARKDITLEYRRRWLLASAVLFGFLFVVVLGIAYNGKPLPPETAAGSLWTVLLFSCITILLRTSSFEEERKAWYALFLAPVDRSAIFYGKLLANTAFLFLVELAVTPSFWIILGVPAPAQWTPLLVSLIAGAIGLAAVGTFLLFLTSASEGREILFPVSLIPLAIPLLLAVIRLAAGAWTGADDLLVWYAVTGGYLIVFGILPWLLFELLVEV
ncbi:MAG: heme exporter protein CcmB [Alicyclobacillaceae bacterium]|nr:heme exporter protein CcmB [Alicyclobacillaceae bacterium]